MNRITIALVACVMIATALPAPAAGLVDAADPAPTAPAPAAERVGPPLEEHPLVPVPSGPVPPPRLALTDPRALAAPVALTLAAPDTPRLDVPDVPLVGDVEPVFSYTLRVTTTSGGVTELPAAVGEPVPVVLDTSTPLPDGVALLQPTDTDERLVAVWQRLTDRDVTGASVEFVAPAGLATVTDADNAWVGVGFTGASPERVALTLRSGHPAPQRLVADAAIEGTAGAHAITLITGRLDPGGVTTEARTAIEPVPPVTRVVTESLDGGPGLIVELDASTPVDARVAYREADASSDASVDVALEGVARHARVTLDADRAMRDVTLTATATPTLAALDVTARAFTGSASTGAFHAMMTGPVHAVQAHVERPRVLTLESASPLGDVALTAWDRSSAPPGESIVAFDDVDGWLVARFANAARVDAILDAAGPDVRIAGAGAQDLAVYARHTGGVVRADLAKAPARVHYSGDGVHGFAIDAPGSTAGVSVTAVAGARSMSATALDVQDRLVVTPRVADGSVRVDATRVERASATFEAPGGLDGSPWARVEVTASRAPAFHAAWDAVTAASGRVATDDPSARAGRLTLLVTTGPDVVRPTGNHVLIGQEGGDAVIAADLRDVTRAAWTFGVLPTGVHADVALGSGDVRLLNHRTASAPAELVLRGLTGGATATWTLGVGASVRASRGLAGVDVAHAGESVVVDGTFTTLEAVTGLAEGVRVVADATLASAVVTRAEDAGRITTLTVTGAPGATVAWDADGGRDVRMTVPGAAAAARVTFDSRAEPAPGLAAASGLVVADVRSGPAVQLNVRATNGLHAIWDDGGAVDARGSAGSAKDLEVTSIGSGTNGVLFTWRDESPVRFNATTDFRKAFAFDAEPRGAAVAQAWYSAAKETPFRAAVTDAPTHARLALDAQSHAARLTTDGAAVSARVDVGAAGGTRASFIVDGARAGGVSAGWSRDADAVTVIALGPPADRVRLLVVPSKVGTTPVPAGDHLVLAGSTGNGVEAAVSLDAHALERASGHVASGADHWNWSSTGSGPVTLWSAARGDDSTRAFFPTAPANASVLTSARLLDVWTGEPLDLAHVTACLAGPDPNACPDGLVTGYFQDLPAGTARATFTPEAWNVTAAPASAGSVFGATWRSSTPLFGSPFSEGHLVVDGLLPFAAWSGADLHDVALRTAGDAPVTLDYEVKSRAGATGSGERPGTTHVAVRKDRDADRMWASVLGEFRELSVCGHCAPNASLYVDHARTNGVIGYFDDPSWQVTFHVPPGDGRAAVEWGAPDGGVAVLVRKGGSHDGAFRAHATAREHASVNHVVEFLGSAKERESSLVLKPWSARHREVHNGSGCIFDESFCWTDHGQNPGSVAWLNASVFTKHTSDATLLGGVRPIVLTSSGTLEGGIHYESCPRCLVPAAEYEGAGSLYSYEQALAPLTRADLQTDVYLGWNGEDKYQHVAKYVACGWETSSLPARQIMWRDVWRYEWGEAAWGDIRQYDEGSTDPNQKAPPAYVDGYVKEFWPELAPKGFPHEQPLTPMVPFLHDADSGHCKPSGVKQ